MIENHPIGIDLYLVRETLRIKVLQTFFYLVMCFYYAMLFWNFAYIYICILHTHSLRVTRSSIRKFLLYLHMYIRMVCKRLSFGYKKYTQTYLSEFSDKCSISPYSKLTQILMIRLNPSSGISISLNIVNYIEQCIAVYCNIKFTFTHLNQSFIYMGQQFSVMS